MITLIAAVFILNFYSYSLYDQRSKWQFNGNGVTDKVLLYIACALFIPYLLILSIWLLDDRKFKIPKLDLTIANESLESKNVPEDTFVIINI